MRRMFVPKKEDVTGSLEKVDSEDLRSTYSSPNVVRVIKSRNIRLAGHAARTEKKRNAYRILVDKHEGKIPLGRLRYRRECAIKVALKEIC